MNRKFLVLLTLIVFVLIPSYVFAFDDTDGHWAQLAIDEAYKYKIVSGYGDNTFKPDNFMTRAELATMINNILNLKTETDKYIPDITSKDWYHAEIRKSVNFGIMLGDQNGNVNPNGLVTREQAVLMLFRAFCINENKNANSLRYVDLIQISPWAHDAFVSFINLNYIKGYEDDSVRPQSYVTRAEMVTMLDRIIDSILTHSEMDKKYNNNILIANKNITLKDCEIYGNLIIGEENANSTSINNVIIYGNMILYAPFDFEQNILRVDGEIVKVYEQNVSSESYYQNQDFGISISLPTNAYAIDYKDKNDTIYNRNDVIIIDIIQKPEFYFENLSNISTEIIKQYKYDSIYKIVENGEIDKCPYELYKDNASSELLIIKRDNIVYVMIFTNIVSNNLVDNVMSNLQLKDGTLVSEHEEIIYKNTKLCLKFRYKDGYVGVDDSYNTGVVYSGDAFFKLFIQVNLITDIEDYSTNEIMALLRTLVTSDGTITKQGTKKIMNYDAIMFNIDSNEDEIISLYVIVGKNLYNFIFKGNQEYMNSIGEDMFEKIVNSMEF